MTPMGRPEIGPPINVRLGDTLLTHVDRYAKDENISRADAIRRLVLTSLLSHPRYGQALLDDPNYPQAVPGYEEW